MREGYAALAAALPELDGIRLALLGLQHTGGSSSLHVLARGRMREHLPGPLDVDLAFPLSIWLRDSGGRWHATRPDRRHRTDGECAIRLQLVPPLTRPPAWIEVLAGGQSAEVRARLPLRWAVPVVIYPNEPWFGCLAPCEAEVPCGRGRHVVRWEAGALRLASHADPEAELVLAALGGEKARCVEVAEAWARHTADLTMLGVGPRGPADEILVRWDDVDAAAQAAHRGGWAFTGAPPPGPMQLASPPTAAAMARVSARRALFRKKPSRPRSAGTTCCHCSRWGTGSRSG